jgi:hypothetical protein
MLWDMRIISRQLELDCSLKLDHIGQSHVLRTDANSAAWRAIGAGLIYLAQSITDLSSLATLVGTDIIGKVDLEFAGW